MNGDGRGRRGLDRLFHHGQAVLVARQGLLERVAQVNQEMLAISNLLGAGSAAFGSLRIHAGPVAADELDPRMLP